MKYLPAHHTPVLHTRWLYQRTSAERVSEEVEIASSRNIANRMVDWSLEQIEADNDNAQIETGTDTGIGSKGGQSARNRRQQTQVQAANDNTPDQAELSDQEKEEIERDIAHFQTVIELDGFWGRRLKQLAGTNFSKMSQLDKIEYLNRLRQQSIGDIWSEGHLGVWGKVKKSMLWVGVKYASNREPTKSIFKTAELAKPIVNQVEGVIEKTDELAETIEEGKEGATELYQTYRENAVLSPVETRKQLARGRDSFRDSFARTRDMMSNPDEAKRVMNRASQEFLTVVNDTRLNPITVGEEIRNKRLPGLSIVGQGRLATLRLTVNELFDGFKTGDWESVAEDLGSQKFRQQLAEAIIPVYGSIASGRRLNDEMAGPTWMRNTDLGMNLVADGLMAWGAGSAVAGAIAGAGIGAVPGLIAMGAGLGIKGVSKLAAKFAIKETSKNLGTREARQKTAGRLGKEVGKETGLRTAFEGVLLGMQQVYNKMYPDGIIAEVKTHAVIVVTSRMAPKELFIAQKLGYL